MAFRHLVTRVARAHWAARSGRLLSTSSSAEAPELAVEMAPDTDGKVAVVFLNRPARMNALSFEMGADLLALTGPEALPDSVRAIVIAGAGQRAFSTGRDLKDSKDHTEEEAERYMRLARDTVLAMKHCALPTVAAVNGFAFGWGLELALACDLRVAYEEATLCFPETSLGIFPGAMGTVLLPRIVGPSVAKDLILTSRRFTGSEAMKLGVVNRTAFSPDATIATAIELAHQIAENAPLGVRGARTVIDQGLDLPFNEHTVLSDQYRFPLNDTEDFAEALLAFKEKRKPDFKGR